MQKISLRRMLYAWSDYFGALKKASCFGLIHSVNPAFVRKPKRLSYAFNKPLVGDQKFLTMIILPDQTKFRLTLNFIVGGTLLTAELLTA